LFIFLNLEIIDSLCYNTTAADAFQQEGGAAVSILISLLLSILAGVIANYISKWLDGKL
jgi:hypothetical protein